MASVEYKNSEISVTELARELGFKNFTLKSDIPLKSGYLGEIFKIQIKGERNEKPDSLAVVVKHVPLTEFHDNLGVYLYYHNESHVYANVFREFDKLQDAAGIKNKFNHCKLYKSSLEPSKESIVMEDISLMGFKASIIGKVMDFEHSKMVLEELGKFHAMSFAMKHTQQEKYNELTKNMTEFFFSEKTNKMIKKIIKDSIIHATEILENPEGIIKMNELSEVAGDMCPNLIQSEWAGPNAVISQGDLWSNNVLFKYNGDTPDEVMILDWQAVRNYSPVLDVLFFLVTSVDDDLTTNHYEKLMKIYHTSLSNFLVKLRCDPNELYSEETFLGELRKFGKLALVNALVLFPVFSNKEEDIVQESKFPEDGSKIIIGSTKRTDLYINRVRSIVDLYLRQNFF